MKHLFPLAEETANEWQEDAQLRLVRLSVHPVAREKPLRASFFFRSESLPDTYLTVTTYVEQNDFRIETRSGKYSYRRPIGDAIKPEDIKIDSLEALEIALQNGGADYLSQNPSGQWRISLNLMYTDLFASTGPLFWRALFSSDSVGTLYIRIDPKSGEVISVKDNQPRTR